MQKHEVFYIPRELGSAAILHKGVEDWDPGYRLETAFIGLQQSPRIMNQSPRSIQCRPLKLKLSKPVLSPGSLLLGGVTRLISCIHSFTGAVINIKKMTFSLGFKTPSFLESVES